VFSLWKEKAFCRNNGSSNSCTCLRDWTETYHCTLYSRKVQLEAQGSGSQTLVRVGLPLVVVHEGLQGGSLRE